MEMIRVSSSSKPSKVAGGFNKSTTRTQKCSNTSNWSGIVESGNESYCNC